MDPKFTFYLQGVQAFPVYGDAVAVDFEQESGERFFRKKWSGKLTFVGPDYTTIKSASINTRFVLQMDMTYNGSTQTIFDGHFYKTDCEIDEDAKTVEVTPATDDEYGLLLDALDKEFNIVQLAPEITKIQAFKRPVFQLYRSGSSHLTNILSGMCWEQECEVKSAHGIIGGGYEFAKISDYIREFTLSGEGSWKGVIPEVFYKTTVSDIDAIGSITKDGYTLELTQVSANVYRLRILDADNTTLWYCQKTGLYGDYVMTPMNGSTGTLTIYHATAYAIFCRIMCDIPSFNGTPTTPIPVPDICENPLNYGYVIQYTPSEAVVITDNLSETPSEWGQTENGEYYVRPVFPPQSGIGDVLPICPDDWFGVSVWWCGTPADWVYEEYGRKEFTLNDAFPLWSVISVLLTKTNSGVTFEGTSAYSDFLYGASNPVRNANYRLFITPKSNLVSAEYEEAAQRGDLSLKQIFDMLRDCFRCYWFIDDGKLRIEHIDYFKRGGSYYTTPVVGKDLTALYYSRTGKPIATAQTKYKYDKPETYSRIEFGWMDDVTEQFNGNPIDIVSAYIEQGRVEKKDISNFTSDIDYVLLNPSGISKDGFVLLCARDVGGVWKIPFVNFGDDDKYVLQNGYMSFLWLVKYYLYDLPATNYEIDGEAGTALGTMPLKTHVVTFPAEWMPNLVQLVRTYIGDGEIKRLSIELLSLTCKATLNYGTT